MELLKIFLKDHRYRRTKKVKSYCTGAIIIWTDNGNPSVHGKPGNWNMEKFL
nr:MAG TPA: hypothetical protein [Caudoviricetes sp.]